MSKQADWTEAILGESALPADEFTWTDGSNYGLDGFHFDQTMNEGVLNHGSLPGATPGPSREGDDQSYSTIKGMPDLPEELFPEVDQDVSFTDTDPLQVVEDGFYLGDMLGDTEVPMEEATRKVASLADLRWLDPTQPQDPRRLPKELDVSEDGGLYSVPELEEAWGVNRRTDGLHRVPAQDLEAVRYTEQIKSPPPATPGIRASSEVFRDAVQRASRRSHYGHPLQKIAQDLVDTLGQDPRLPSVMERLASEHGLVGTVFIRAASFPGLKNGKWASDLKRIARRARYVLGEDIHAQKVGKVRVSSVPWEHALEHYRPILSADGYEIDSMLSPKDALRKAFLAGPKKVGAAVGHNLPKNAAAADRVSAQDAFRAMAAQGPRELEIVASLEKRALQEKRARLRGEIQKWEKAGHLSAKEAFRLASSPADISDIRRALASLVHATPSRDYDGSGVGTSEHRVSVFESLGQKEAALEAGERLKLSRYLAKHVNAGLLTSQEATRIMMIPKPVHELHRIAAMAVQVAGTHRRVVFDVEDVREYEGPVRKAAQQQARPSDTFSAEQRKIMAAAEAGGVPATEIRSFMRWARQQMSEGVMGQDFNQLLAARWSTPILQASAKLLRELRAAHEGLSGNIYVDASAYATTGGLKGCEAGALKHRANQVRTVLAMPQCGSCVHARQGTCGIYNKPIIQTVSDVVPDPRGFQARALRMADAPDAEVTASLFSPAEFGLQSLMDQEISLEEDLGAGGLGEILFGDGLTLED